MAIPILLKTTIGAVADDWNVGRFSLLAAHLRTLRDARGELRYEVFARDRVENATGDDRDLALAATGAYAQVWLIAADPVGALTETDIENIKGFRRAGGGILLTRDHQDLGACVTKLGALGATQYFQSVNPDPEPARRCRDDRGTPSISWPNFHSGANGDLQRVTPVEPVHVLMKRPRGGVIQQLPAHPHEGAVGAPDALGGSARVAALPRVPYSICVSPWRKRGRAGRCRTPVSTISVTTTGIPAWDVRVSSMKHQDLRYLPGRAPWTTCIATSRTSRLGWAGRAEGPAHPVRFR